MSTKAQKIARLRNKKYRDAFVASQISVGLPFQIRALREQRGWKQSQLAGKAEMLQPRISAMESPGGAKFTLETLRRLASALDVALVVRFVPFRELVDWSERFNPDTFAVPSFDEDMATEKHQVQGSTFSPEGYGGATEPEESYVQAMGLLGSLNKDIVRVGRSMQERAVNQIRTYTAHGSTLQDLANAEPLRTNLQTIRIDVKKHVSSELSTIISIQNDRTSLRRLA